MQKIGAWVALIGSVFGIIATMGRAILKIANIGPGANIPDILTLPVIGLLTMPWYIYYGIGTVLCLVLLVISRHMLVDANNGDKILRPGVIGILLGVATLPFSAPAALVIVGSALVMIAAMR